MKILTLKKLLLSTVVSSLTIGCAELEKPQSLLSAEQAYSSAANNPNIQKYATDKLAIANKTLLSATTAETVEDMESLAYISHTQIATAISVATAEQSRQNSTALLTQKDKLITTSINQKKEEAQKKMLSLQQNAQKKLLVMEAKEAEREILLAFGKIEFVSGTANLVPGASQGIDLLADYMRKYPDKTIVIAGHTDSKGSSELNQTLSQQRADFIRDVLISKGLAAKRISALGYGESQPVASNITNAGRQKNRRIDINFD